MRATRTGAVVIACPNDDCIAIYYDASAEVVITCPITCKEFGFLPNATNKFVDLSRARTGAVVIVIGCPDKCCRSVT